MQEQQITGPRRERALDALRQSQLFGSLTPSDLELVLTHGRWVEYSPTETIVREGEKADSFFLLVDGEAEIMVSHTTVNDQIEVGRIYPVGVFGEMGLLLNHPRTASVIALEPTSVLQFSKEAFHLMMDGIQGYARQLSVSLAGRLAQTSRRVPLPHLSREEMGVIDPNTLRCLPSQFLVRHRALPISIDAGILKLGLVDDPTPQVVNAIRRMLPGMQLRPFRITNETFEDVLRTHGLSDGLKDGDEKPSPGDEPPVVVGVVAQPSSGQIEVLTPEDVRHRLSKLEPLLQRMVAEGASDLHLCAGQKPRWRIDGDLYTIEDCRPLQPMEVEDMLAGIMTIPSRKEFQEDLQTDFAYSMGGIGRFRVNLYYDDRGSSAVLRHIPSTIPTLQQLGLPQAMRSLLELNQGLVLVTGPTGSGKSTTLAALIEEINQKHPKHIITLEDPIEFVYESKRSLINQRQIGIQAKSFGMGLRGALREDPDIVLVGEMRDMETMMLAIETANTGHLVLGTLHTRGTISTIERIIDLFPADLQNQIRTSLSDLLRGVLSQVLCKRKGGGRVAAYEFMSLNHAAANLIRQNKTHQLTTIMTTQRPNMPLNAHLEELVKKDQLDLSEAFARSNDRDDLKNRLGRYFDSSVMVPAFPEGPPTEPGVGLGSPGAPSAPGGPTKQLTGLERLAAAAQNVSASSAVLPAAGGAPPPARNPQLPMSPIKSNKPGKP